MIVCKWCGEAQENYAILTVHQMIKNGIANCKRNPSIPKQYDGYVNTTKETRRKYKPRDTNEHPRI